MRYIEEKGIEWWNGRAEFYFSDPAVEQYPNKFKTKLAFLVADKKTR